MTTGNQTIEETLRVLLSGSREEMNKLQTTVTSGAAALAFTYELGGIQAGAQITIGTEMFRVWSVNSGAKTAVVEPGILGSTTAAHTAGDLVYVNPRFPRYAVLNAMNEELRSLSSPSNGLYRMASTEFTYNGSVTDYGLPAGVIDVYEAYLDTPGPEKDWPRLKGVTWNPNANTTDFTNGASIHIPSGIPGRTVRVLYKAAFNPVADLTAELATEALLPLEMQDILHLGVLLRLGPGREIKRNFTEQQSGDSRRATEVPPTAVGNSFAWARNLRANRITEERTRLERLYPPRLPLN